MGTIAHANSVVFDNSYGLQYSTFSSMLCLRDQIYCSGFDRYEMAVIGLAIIAAIENGSDDDTSCLRIRRLHDLDVPHICVNAIGEPCPTPSSRGLQAERLPLEATAHRSLALGLALASVAGLASGSLWARQRRCSAVCTSRIGMDREEMPTALGLRNHDALSHGAL